ncbi:alpha/beta hydrolase [Pseudalkalibacillus sp. JSM 102089]|uniref:alpha/beta hydrolase n=1 Tax=Pseudalkalibacillus sp. JSM 102089 TaxID=3229856 RepID=UPI003524E469
MRFADLQNRVIELVESKENEEALRVMEEAKEKFPHKRDRLGHWRANIYVMEGKNEEGVGELKEVLKHGLWWNPEILTSDPELTPLQAHPEFKSIVSQCREIFENTKASAHAELTIQGHSEADTVIFPLHWKGSNAKDFAEQWSDENLVTKYLMGFPQSSQLFSYQCYAWDDMAVAYNDVRKTYCEFTQRVDISDKKQILAGASQGGSIATQMSLSNDMEEFNFFIAVAPAFDIHSLKEILHNQLNPEARGCIITGDQDPFYESVLEASQLFEDYQIPCKLIVNEGIGHEWPNEFPNVLEEAVRFVTKQ